MEQILNTQVNNSTTEVIVCVERGLVQWAPFIFLVIVAPFYLWSLKCTKTVNKAWRFSILNLVRTVLCLLLVVTSLFNTIWAGMPLTGAFFAQYTASTSFILSLVAVLFLLRWDYMKGIRSSGVLSIYWVLSLVVEIFQCKNEEGIGESIHYVITYYVTLGMLVLQFLLTFFLDDTSQEYTSPESQSLLTSSKGANEEMDKENKVRPNPHDRVCFWSKITFTWLTREVVSGYRKPITFSSVLDLCVSDRCDYLLKMFSKYFPVTAPAESLEADRFIHKQTHYPLFLALMRVMWKEYTLAFWLRVSSMSIGFTNPLLLGALIRFVESEDTNILTGLGIAGSMLLVNFAVSILLHNYIHMITVSGMKARTIVNATVYRKALRLSSSSRKMTTIGQQVNLLSVDAQKVLDFFQYYSLILTMPIAFCIAVVLLWQTIGPPSLAGVAVLLFMVVFNGIYLTGKAYMLQKEQMDEKDKRFKVTGEILSGMKVLKLYAWEPSYEERVLNYRHKELRTIKLANLITSFGSMSWLLTPYLVSLAIFTTYMLVDSNNILTAEKAFVTMSLIGMLSWPLQNLPLAVSNIILGTVSLKRLSKYLSLEELDGNGPERVPCLNNERIAIRNATMSWGKDEIPTLTNINMTVPTGELVAVVGAVGSGKSSLLNALLGEMFIRRGKIEYDGSFAYVPQQAWIIHDSLKENILLGKYYSQRKYEKILKACALQQDLAMLTNGDETEIGERGINLSGGQKQRVSLARAVYQDEDIYLLDDPLSAVDAHIGKHIFEKVIGPMGLLRNKTRVFVTHGITYLPDCDAVVVLKDGCVQDIGKYEELLTREGPFADVIKSYLENEAYQSAEEQEALMEVLARMSSDGFTSGYTSVTSGLESDGGRKIQKSRKRKQLLTPKDGRSVMNQTKLIEDEKEGTGTIGAAVILAYLKASGYIMAIGVICSQIFYVVFQVITNIWLSEWTGDNSINVTLDREQSLYRLATYGYLGIGQLLTAALQAICISYGCYNASNSFHKNLLHRTMRAPMAFFDTTPLGRIMNRFTKDIDVLDFSMPMFLNRWLVAVSPVIIILILICYSTPVFTAVCVPLVLMFGILQRLFVIAMRQWKRIHSVRLSPIYSHFDESVVGSTSIRAYGRQDQFIAKCDRLIDDSQKPFFLVITGYRWVGIFMETIGACIVFFASLFAVLQRDTITPGLAGLSVSYALQVTVMMNSVIRFSTELEALIVSIERVEEYFHIESEAEWDIPWQRPAADWPTKGVISFSNYCTRYRQGLDLVLRDIKCDIKAGEKVGIVGRTGAGKSSLSLALFRLIEAASGGIRIDGRLVSEMGLHSLRNAISIIPQDPVVFSGSLRSNLDPFDRYTDSEVWEALEHAHLKTYVLDSESALEVDCGEGGEALSVGQRQLLCLARALLRKSKILILDEATAAVDYETDTLIQATIRDKFKDCTILTVAHRLHTVMDYDRIMVLSAGRIQEMDSPLNLLNDKKSLFFSLACDAGLA